MTNNTLEIALYALYRLENTLVGPAMNPTDTGTVNDAIIEIESKIAPITVQAMKEISFSVRRK